MRAIGRRAKLHQVRIRRHGLGHRGSSARFVVMTVHLDRGEVDSGSRSLAETVLRDQGMPPDELRVVLTTLDRDLVRQHLELHLERLEERLVAQRRWVAAIERILAHPGGRLS
jgi:hypothetical protein